MQPSIEEMPSQPLGNKELEKFLIEFRIRKRIETLQSATRLTVIATAISGIAGIVVFAMTFKSEIAFGSWTSSIITGLSAFFTSLLIDQVASKYRIYRTEMANLLEEAQLLRQQFSDLTEKPSTKEIAR